MSELGSKYEGTMMIAGSAIFCYDANGNQIQKMDGSTTSYTYDAENRMVSVSGAATATFVYNGDGKRVKGVVGGVTTTCIGNYRWTPSGCRRGSAWTALAWWTTPQDITQARWDDSSPRIRIIPQPGSPLAWDRYSYVNSNPVKYTDPSGHMLDDGCHSSGAPEIQMQLFTLFIWVGFPAIVKPDTTSLGERAENSYDPSGEKIRQGQVLNSCFWSWTKAAWSISA